MTYQIGIDVGGTNTDAIILDEKRKVIAATKQHTTKDIQTGISNALHEVLKQSGVNLDYITDVMLGTTQATNAIVERKNLATVGVIRLGYPATASIVPFTEWPSDMVSLLSGTYQLVHGGYEFDGNNISPIDYNEIRKALKDFKGKVDSIAIVGVFSSLNPDQEENVKKLATEILGNVPISISSKIGSLGLIARENATILNASLYKVINKVAIGFDKALQDEGVKNCNKYLTQNDGTLMTLDYAKQYPILTIGSGPTNSIRGAAYLAKVKEALVLDIGGTTSDIGVLINGFPRESSLAVNVGGIQTNFRMPDILSVGLGGGTIIRQLDNGDVAVGPDSVGYNITQESLVFGGQTITATDIAVAMGITKVGDPAKVQQLDEIFVKKAFRKISSILEDAIDKMKISAEKVDLILVGGGAIIAPQYLKGIDHIFRNEKGGVANAIGATIAQIGGQYEKIYQYAQYKRADALYDTQELAKKQAIQAGANPESIHLVDVEEMPLAYAPGETTKVKVKVIGDFMKK
ncbi:hydantoinase/oxoprolinase N-terminal domain-containing protein [Liquorilactobacillus hordei]|uniref:hydantoinase/oxoprolinase N-terminal domain-containing protein n=1 Tax=Liquorilactobacillus hordei TaxID=468911 RepID=UPI0039ECE2D7